MCDRSFTRNRNPWWRPREAGCADERNELHTAEIVGGEILVTGAGDSNQSLKAQLFADRNDQTPPNGQLVQKCRRNAGAASGNHDRIEWRFFRPTESTISGTDRHILIAGLRQAILRTLRQGGMSLDGVDFGCDVREDRGSVT